MSVTDSTVGHDSMRLPPEPVRPSLPVHIVSKARPDALRTSVRHALEHRRIFLLWPYAIIVGLVASVNFLMPPAYVLPAVSAAIVLAIALNLERLNMLRALGLIGACWLGFCLLPIHGALFGTPMLARPAYGTFEMQVDMVLSSTGRDARVVVSAIAPQPETRSLPIRRARLFVRGGAGLAPGDVIRGAVRFYPVPGPVVPNGFDSQFHAYLDGIGAYGSTTGPFEVIAKGDPSTPARIVGGIRSAIAERVDRAIPQPAAGIARALIIGDQSAVPESARDTMAKAGLAHVLSVSGLHLTIVAGLVLMAIRTGLALLPGLHGRIAVKRVAAGAATIAALGYFAVSGGNVAALRSTIMLVLVLGAVVFGRRALTMRNVAIAALLVIATDPASIFRPSFQLSFAAVVALIAVWEVVPSSDMGSTSILGRVGGYLWGIVITSVVAGLATLLFSVYHFQQTSPLGVLGNLLSLPLVGFVMMPSAVLATLAMPFGWEEPFLVVMGWSIDWMLVFGHLVAAWSAGLSYSPLLKPLALGIGLAAFAWFTFLPTWHRLIGPIAAVPLIVLFALDRPPDVLIADTTQAVAMRVEGDMAMVAGKSDSFAVDVWRETYADSIAAKAPLACDSVGCFGSSPRGFTIALIRDPAAFFEDCASADLVIARRAVPASCQAKTIIDEEALARGGTQWLGWNEADRTFEVRSAISSVSQPWRVPPP